MRVSTNAPEKMCAKPALNRCIVSVPLSPLVGDFACPVQIGDQRFDVRIIVLEQDAIDIEYDGAGFEMGGVGPVETPRVSIIPPIYPGSRHVARV